MKNILLLFCILFIALASNNKLFSQDNVKSEKSYGMRINLFYDFQVKRYDNLRIIHIIPLFTFDYKNSDFYLGPQYAYVFQPTPIADEIYEKNSFGFNFGYRYYSNELLKNTRLFGQFNYSIYQIKYKEYQLGAPFSTNIKKIIYENFVSLGLDYKFFNKFHTSLGVGFGSYNGFFMVSDNYSLTSYFGIEYRF